MLVHDPEVWYVDIDGGNARVRYDHGQVSVSPPSPPVHVIENELRGQIAAYRLKAARAEACLRAGARQWREARSPTPAGDQQGDAT